MNPREIEALIKLLADDDPLVLDQVEAKLKEYFHQLSPSTWSQFLSFASDKAAERLLNLYKQYNFDNILELARQWVQQPQFLSKAMYFISRLFNPFLDYQEFLALIYKVIDFFPPDFPDNYTDVEQARHLTYVIFKGLKFNWQLKNYQHLNPEYVLRNWIGAHQTIGLIMVAIMQHLGRDWLLLSDIKLLHTYVVVPVDRREPDYFFIDPRTGRLVAETPLADKEVEQLIKTSPEHYNLLSIKTLVVAFLQLNILPRNLDDHWYILNRINMLIAEYGKKFSS